MLATSPRLEERGSAVAVEGFEATLGADLESEWGRIEKDLQAAGWSVPRVRELGIDTELLHVLLREQRLVRVSEEFVYLPSQLDEMVARLAELPDQFTVADFRDAFQLTRKYAVPLLEWLDARRVTVRSGDTRTRS